MVKKHGIRGNGCDSRRSERSFAHGMYYSDEGMWSVALKSKETEMKERKKDMRLGNTREENTQ